MLSATPLLELAAIVVAGMMVGNELAVAVFFHPRISALDDATHVRAAQARAAAPGRAMPFWYALTLLLSGAVAFWARSTLVMSCLLSSVAQLLTSTDGEDCPALISYLFPAVGLWSLG